MAPEHSVQVPLLPSPPSVHRRAGAGAAGGVPDGGHHAAPHPPPPRAAAALPRGGGVLAGKLGGSARRLLDLQLQVPLNGQSQLLRVHRRPVHLPRHPLRVPLHLFHGGLLASAQHLHLRHSIRVPGPVAVLLNEADLGEDMGRGTLRDRDRLDPDIPELPAGCHGPCVPCGASDAAAAAFPQVRLPPATRGQCACPGAVQVAAAQHALGVQPCLADRGDEAR